MKPALFFIVFFCFQIRILFFWSVNKDDEKVRFERGCLSSKFIPKSGQVTSIDVMTGTVRRLETF